MKRKLFAIFILFLTAGVWGFGGVGQVIGGDNLPAMAFNAARFLVGAVVLFPLSFLFDQAGLRTADAETKRKCLRRTACAAVLAGCMLFFAAGSQQIGAAMIRDPGKAGFITSLYTALTPLLYLILFRRRLGWNVWVGVVLATGGLYLICLREGNTPTFGAGELFLLVGALFWAGHILVVDHFIRDIDPLRFSSWQFFTVSVVSALASVLFEDVTVSAIRDAGGAILFCGLVSISIGFTLQAVGQKLLGDPTGSAIILSTEAIFSLLGGFLWNLVTPDHLHVDQEILPVGYLGCAIVFIGIVLTQIEPKKLRRGASADSPSATEN